MSPTTARHHPWKFFRTGGLNQAALESSADLRALGELDQKLWVALSCPVKGLEFDEKTLALIDADGDGHIHVREVVAAVEWAAAHLKDPGDLLRRHAMLPLAAINDQTPEGRNVLAAARRVLTSMGKPGADAVAVEDTDDTAKILAATAPNGDGIITLRATTDGALQALIKDIIATVGGVPDRAGGEGINAEKVDLFFKDLATYLEWLDTTASKNIPELGATTGAACVAVRDVHAKIDDYFARCRLAAFDARTVAALNKQEDEHLAAAAKDLAISTEEIAGFPLARVDIGARLPLLEGVNPAWAGALATFQKIVVGPLLGANQTSLSAAEWAAIVAKFAPFEAWLGSRTPLGVEKLGADRARQIATGPARAALTELMARDKALEPEYTALSSVGRLARYHRDLGTLLHNFVNFADFYSPTQPAIFQAGMLYLDDRSAELCLRVLDPAAHATLAVMSKAFVVYLDCRRAGGETMKICACFTQGDSDYLFVGRNGLFYDRKGRDWDATITRIIDNPISIQQAFWSPYKKLIRMIEEQVALRAATSAAASTAQLQGAAAAVAGTAAKPPPPPPPPPKKFDVGTVAALGVGLGAIATAFGVVFGKFLDLPAWQIPFVILGLMLVISVPSMVVAGLKIRQRTIGPLLEANGWAINGRVKVNLPFGNTLTQLAQLPPGAHRALRDPYEDKAAVRMRWMLQTAAVLLVIAAIEWFVLGYGPFASKPAAPASTPAAAAKK